VGEVAGGCKEEGEVVLGGMEDVRYNLILRSLSFWDALGASLKR
jgi:hypothetical protein